MKEFIEIPFGAKDSKLCGWEYTIPEGFVASIENGKITVKKEEGEDEKIRKRIYNYINVTLDDNENEEKEKWLTWLEKQGEQKSQRMISAEAKEALYDKPNWSEEDERLCSCLIKEQEEALDNVKNDKYGHSEIISDLKEMYNERIDWLKSLKQRMKGE